MVEKDGELCYTESEQRKTRLNRRKRPAGLPPDRGEHEMNILVCNVGSTSLKFKLYDMPAARELARCGVERVGSDHDAIFRYEQIGSGKKLAFDKIHIPDYETGIRLFLETLTGKELGVIDKVTEIERVGYKATLSKGHFGIHELDEKVLQGMEDWISLAPLHNRAYLDAIAVMRSLPPGHPSGAEALRRALRMV